MTPLTPSTPCCGLGDGATRTTSTGQQEPQSNHQAFEPFQDSSQPSLLQLLSHQAANQLFHQEASLLIMGPLSGRRAFINSIADPMERQIAIIDEALRIVKGERDGEAEALPEEELFRPRQ